jgi:hypothetical protein
LAEDGRPVMSTEKPSCAKRGAMARSIPPAAPVIVATLELPLVATADMARMIQELSLRAKMANGWSRESARGSWGYISTQRSVSKGMVWEEKHSELQVRRPIRLSLGWFEVV